MEPYPLLADEKIYGWFHTLEVYPSYSDCLFLNYVITIASIKQSYVQSHL